MPENIQRNALEASTRVAAAVDAFARGEIVVSDDDDRENEGDLFVAALTPEKMAFIIRHTSGSSPCCCRSTMRAARLDPMVSANDAPLGTAFT